MEPTHDAIAACLLDLAQRRGAGASFCPSEAARALSTDWRGLMPRLRAVAAGLVAEGQLEAVRRGRPVCPLHPGGPFRLRQPRTGGCADGGPGAD